MNRETLGSALLGSIRLIKEVSQREVTLKQAYYKIKMRIFNTNRELNDDFDWSQYHDYYQEELISTARLSTLIPKARQFEFRDGKIRQLDSKIKPLHNNHHLLYEIISNLNPSSVLEVGFGGGDHLRNLSFFIPNLKLFGVDRSEGQLATLRQRHPHDLLKADLTIVDVTMPEIVLPTVDVVYSQAVFMHISEKENRFYTALTNAFMAAKYHVVMVENWTQHDFLAAVKSVTAVNADWVNAKYYYAPSQNDDECRAMIVSKIDLPFMKLENFETLLQGRKLQIH